MKLTEINQVWPKGLLWLGIAITLSIFLLNFALVGFGVYGDGLGYYTPLRSLIFDGNLRIDDEYQFLSESASRFGGGVRVTGIIPEYSKYTIGVGLVLSPFFILGHFAAIALRILGLNVEANGLSWPYELFYCFGSISLGIAGLILCYQAARRFFSRTASVLAVAGVWFASPLTFYLCLEVSMSHAVSQFLVSLFLYLCITTVWINRRRQQILLGLILGLAMLVRPQNALFGIVPLVISFAQNRRGTESDFPEERNLIGFNQSNLVALVVVGIVAVLMQIPQILVYQWQYGGLLQIPYFLEAKTEGYESSFNWIQPQILNVLFSGFHGLFSWHPLLFLAILGLVITTKKLPNLAWSLLAAFGLQVYLIASWWCWWQGASFGGRMFSNCSFIFVFGLAALWDWLKGKVNNSLSKNQSWQYLGLFVTLFCMIWNALLVLQYESGMIPPEEPVPMVQIVRNQIFAVPFFLKHIFDR